MRDPYRIYKFCNKLAKMWSEVPDWRFGQLISNLICDLESTDFFYLEDEVLFKYLEEKFEKFRNV